MAPEFHTTGHTEELDEAPPTAAPGAATAASDYKALIYFLWTGGADTFNMLMPDAMFSLALTLDGFLS